MTHDLIAKHDKEEGKLLLKFYFLRAKSIKLLVLMASEGEKRKNFGERERKNENFLVLREQNWTKSKKVITNYVRIPTI